MKNISIFGYGVTTKPIVKMLNKKGIKCDIFDDKFLHNCEDEFGNKMFPSSCFDPQNSRLEILSPGIPPTHVLVQKAKNLVGEYDYFYDCFSKSYRPSTIWISGTNGKTTLTQMLTTLLSEYGAKSGGNIGNPLAELYSEKVPLWVLETSSFSIHYIRRACPDLYILLPVREDHIIWHGSFEVYIQDKLKPLSLMMKNSYAIIPEEFSKRVEVQNFRGKIFFYKNSDFLAQEININKKDIAFKEPFLLDGLLALYATKILYNQSNIALLNTFKIGKHKIEEILDKNGNLWVDDSKGTNVDATLEAIKCYKDKKIYLILGGDDKGADQRPIFELAKGLDIEIFAIGSNEEKLLELGKSYGIKISSCKKLKNAVEKIKISLNCNGVGLLSPAAASLDQFSSYKERGELFQQYVLEEDKKR